MATRTPPRYRKLGYLRNSSDANRALLNKLVRRDTGDTDPNNQTVSITRDTLEKQSKDIGRDAVDADAVFQLLPDMELAEQVLVGSILSPKDMSTVELGFKVKEGMFDTEIVGDLLEIVKCYFKQDYRIDDKLDGMLEDILFKKGAHIQVVIPENNLDQLINGSTRVSTEMFGQVRRRLQTSQPMGFLGHPRETRVSLESFHDRNQTVPQIQIPCKKDTARPFPYLTVTDNFDALKLPAVSQRQRSRRIHDLVNRRTVSMEAASTGLSAEQVDKLFQKNAGDPRPTQVMTPTAYQSRPSVGHPLVLSPPIESMIPVCVPGQPNEHVGYFMLIDQHGRPVVKDGKRDYYGELRTSFQQGGREDSTSELVRLTKEAFGGVGRDNAREYDELQEAYSEIIENDLVNRLRNGIYGEEFSVGFTQEIYHLMFHRALKAQQTQLLYIPAEFVVYAAFNYSDDGVGESLLKQSNMIANMRSVLLFADTMSGVRNAIGRKRASITVDPKDPDPQKTISDIQAAVIEASSRGFPLGSPDPAQTMDYLNRSGFDFAINVEGDNYPTTKVEFDDYNTNVSAGNKELQDYLRRIHISGMGMNPEQIDPSQSPDFATSVVNNNLIMTRRVLRYQKRFCEFLTQFVQVYTAHSSMLIEKIEKEFAEQKGKLTDEQKKDIDDDLVEQFIDAIEVSLPSPDTTKIDQQLQAFEQYTQLLDRTLEAYINADIFPAEFLAREEGAVQQVTAVIRAYFQRLWLERNNVTPELLQLTEMDKRTPNFNLLEIQKVMQGSLGNAVQKYLDDLKKKQDKWAAKNQPEETTDEFGGDGAGDDGTGDGDDGFGDGGDDFGEGGEDDGLGEETGLDEETAGTGEEGGDENAEAADDTASGDPLADEASELDEPSENEDGTDDTGGDPLDDEEKGI